MAFGAAATRRSLAKAVESLHVETAGVMLEQGHDSIDDVARESGSTSRDHMRRAFVGVLPREFFV